MGSRTVIALNQATRASVNFTFFGNEISSTIWPYLIIVIRRGLPVVLTFQSPFVIKSIVVHVELFQASTLVAASKVFFPRNTRCL